MMFPELENDLLPTEYNGSMWQAADYVFKQTEPLLSLYRVTSVIINGSFSPQDRTKAF